MADIRAILGERVKHYRERLDLSQRELAVRVSLDAQTIYRLENGRSWPDFATVSTLAQTFGVETGDLFIDPNQPKPSVEQAKEVLLEALSAGSAALEALRRTAKAESEAPDTPEGDADTPSAGKARRR